MKVIHQIYAAQIAHKVNGVGNNAFMPFPQLQQPPTQKATIYIGNAYRQKDSKEVYGTQHQQTKGPRKKAHIRKGEQNDCSDSRVVHGSEYTAEYAG